MAGVWNDRGTIVEARPLIDILSPDEVSRVRLIKIDVEGAELAVLGGLWPILDKFPREVEIVVEISARDATEVFDLFEAAGFRAYGLTNHYSYKCYLSPAPIAVPVRLQQRPTLGGDFIFSRRDLAFL